MLLISQYFGLKVTLGSCQVNFVTGCRSLYREYIGIFYRYLLWDFWVRAKNLKNLGLKAVLGKTMPLKSIVVHIAPCTQILSP